MGTRRLRAWPAVRKVALLVGLGLLLGGCTTATSRPAPATPAGHLPAVRLVAAPTEVCRTSTQLRLQPEVAAGGELPDTTWALFAAAEEVPLITGTWSPAAGPLRVPFPQGAPLTPGAYRVYLYSGEQSVAEHEFVVSAQSAQIAELGVALVPDGDTLDGDPPRMEPGLSHFYVNFAYQGACYGAPYWVTLHYGGEVIFRHTGDLEQSQGTENVACYRLDGAPFAEGDYRAELSLMGEAQRELAFTIASAPSPPPTPTPRPEPTATTSPLPAPECAPLFTAAGVTPAGAPYLPGDIFDWYVQAVYAGSHCEHLAPGTAWRSAWYRDGEPVRAAQGTWDGGAEGTLWDALTGPGPENPFVLYGTYSVTLEIDALAPLTATFRVLGYPQEDATLEP